MSRRFNLDGVSMSVLTAEAVVREIEKENARKRELAKQRSFWTKITNCFKPRVVVNPTQHL